jgi:hypothetical protein
MNMSREYVEQRGGGYYLAGSRVSLDSMIYEFLRGESHEGIAQPFPAFPRQCEARFDELARASRETNPLLYPKLQKAKRTRPALS